MAATAKWYENSAHYLTSPFGDWLGWNHREALRELPPATRTLLDIGCGDGRFVYAAAEQGIDAMGIDHSERLVRLGNRRYRGTRLSLTSIEDFHQGGKRFDAVTLFEVIEHVPSPLDLLRVVTSVLRPGGVLVVSTPNRLGYPWGRHPMDRPPHHLTRWTPDTLRTALERAGLFEVRIVLSPGAVGLRSYLMDHIQLGLVRRAAGASPCAAPGLGPGSRLLTIAVVTKDRLIRLLTKALLPLAGSRYAGGAMLAIALRPDE